MRVCLLVLSVVVVFLSVVVQFFVVLFICLFVDIVSDHVLWGFVCCC